MRVAIEVDLGDLDGSSCHTTRMYGGDRRDRVRPSAIEVSISR